MTSPSLQLVSEGIFLGEPNMCGHVADYHFGPILDNFFGKDYPTLIPNLDDRRISPFFYIIL